MVSGRETINFIIFAALYCSAQRSTAVPPLIVLPNLAEQYRAHFNVSRADLALTFASRQQEAHVLMRQMLERYELTHVSSGATVYFGGFSTVGAKQIICPEHGKSLSTEYYDARKSLTYPSLNCMIYQEVSCVMFERARKTFYLPLEKVRLTQKFYANDDERDAIQACEGLSRTNLVNIKELIARRANATASPLPPSLLSTSVSIQNV